MKEIKGLEQKNDLIFVGILPSKIKDLFFMFVIKSKKHLFCYKLVKTPAGDYESLHNEFIEIISSDDQFNKEDIYLNKVKNGESSVIVKKYIKG